MDSPELRRLEQMKFELEYFDRQAQESYDEPLRRPKLPELPR